MTVCLLFCLDTSLISCTVGEHDDDDDNDEHDDDDDDDEHDDEDDIDETNDIECLFITKLVNKFQGVKNNVFTKRLQRPQVSAQKTTAAVTQTPSAPKKRSASDAYAKKALRATEAVARASTIDPNKYPMISASAIQSRS